MSGPGFALLLCVVIAAGTIGGGATRYERVGPAAERAVAGAIAVLALTTAVLLSLGLFAVTALYAAGTAWRLLGVVCAVGVLGALVAARFVDHALALRSWRRAWRAVLMDVPWRRITDALLAATSQAGRLAREQLHKAATRR